ncbi:MAG TPA: ABC transporter ATP-binding protein [Verrucomicrobiota bacterium]|nr:ABC transporter ATP-binding protein [Verrucomicrobiota bacterium]
MISVMSEGDSFLEVQQVARHFGGQRALNEVSFRIPDDSLTAIIGPNGAGKTTLFNLIAGALSPTRGHVRFRGRQIASPNQACAAGIARTFQNVRLFGGLTVLDNVMVGMGGGGLMSGLLGLQSAREQERLRRKKAIYLLDNVGIAHLASHPAGEIPFGQQRLVELTRAMATEPKLLLLDEPAAGLNATETAALGRIVRQIHQQGVAVLLVEHDMSLVMNLAERILVLEHGRLIADGDPGRIQADPQVRAAYLGSEET